MPVQALRQPRSRLGPRAELVTLQTLLSGNLNTEWTVSPRKRTGLCETRYKCRNTGVRLSSSSFRSHSLYIYSLYIYTTYIHTLPLDIHALYRDMHTLYKHCACLYTLVTNCKTSRVCITMEKANSWNDSCFLHLENLPCMIHLQSSSPQVGGLVPYSTLTVTEAALGTHSWHRSVWLQQIQA